MESTGQYFRFLDKELYDEMKSNADKKAEEARIIREEARTIYNNLAKFHWNEEKQRHEREL